jgi:flagellar basal-body rod protein FlgC
MSLFGAMNTAASGLTLFRTWLDATADNLANLRSAAKPGETQFESRLVLAEANENGDGAHVAAIVSRDETPHPEFDPTHPYADENGMVRYPGVDVGVEMTNMVAAQRGYQANIAALTAAKESYQAALRIGH